MTAGELAQYLRENVPNFLEVQVHGPGVGYHYTSHAPAILASGRLFGAPINADLDRTQQTFRSPPATDTNGVVFAYERLEDAEEEAFGSDVLKIEFSAAVSALHGQESDDLPRAFGLDPADCPTPRTLLILVADVRSVVRA